MTTETAATETTKTAPPQELHEKLAAEVKRKTRQVNVLGHLVPAVNSAVLREEIGQLLLEQNPKQPFAIVFSPAPPGKVDVDVYGDRNRFDIAKLKLDRLIWQQS